MENINEGEIRSNDEIEKKLLPHAKRSLKQKIRRLDEKFLKGLISQEERFFKERKLYTYLDDRINKAEAE